MKPHKLTRASHVLKVYRRRTQVAADMIERVEVPRTLRDIRGPNGRILEAKWERIVENCSCCQGNPLRPFKRS